MESFSDEEPNLEIDIPVIEPYRFEPSVEVNDDSQLDDFEEEMLRDDQSERLGNTDWCTCFGCVEMPTGKESLCCHEIRQSEEVLEEEEIGCLTESDTFKENCLLRNVIKVSLSYFFIDEGPIDDDTPINESYRYVAYRRFTRWIWKHLRKNERKVVPSCCVRLIREAYPSEEYAGFKYARP